jgi:hypothetical protein
MWLSKLQYVLLYNCSLLQVGTLWWNFKSSKFVTSGSLRMSIPALGVNMIAEVNVELLPYKENRPCSVCKMLTTFTCAECKNIAYCSKGCRRAEYPTHKSVCQRIIKPYAFLSPLWVFQNKSFSIGDFQKGPYQSLDPPDTEDYADIQLLWRWGSKRLMQARVKHLRIIKYPLCITIAL